MKKLFSIVLAVVLAFCLVSCGSTNDEISGGGLFNDDLTLVGEPTMVVDYEEYLGWTVEITGTLKNTSGHNLSYASIEFSIYDENGYSLDSAFDNISSLREGDTWRFKATNLWTDERPVRFVLAEIDCW